MKAVDVEKPSLNKPIMITAMQDMGNVGSIAIDFINKSMATSCFRYVLPPFPNYVVDNGGFIDFVRHRWEYRYGDDLVVFGGGEGQPETNQELYDLCQDVIDVAKEHSVQLIYTLGAFHTSRNYDKKPMTLVTSTSQELSQRISSLGLTMTPGSSLITGYNGLMLGFAKENGLQGIGLFAEIDDPRIPQYRSAKSLLATLERLTYQKFKGSEELEEIAGAVDDEIDRMKGSSSSSSSSPDKIP
jgi:proteasome assembly chaperone (PAC2) family protein